MLSRVLIGLIRFYQVGISSWTPASCRFHPTCSGYAIEAIRVHGSIRGSWLAFRRFLRCHPWGGMGYDPVPLPGDSSGGGSVVDGDDEDDDDDRDDGKGGDEDTDERPDAPGAPGEEEMRSR